MSIKINLDSFPELLNGAVANVVLEVDGEKHMFYSALQAYTYLTSDNEEHRTSVGRCVDQTKIRHYFATPKCGYNDPKDLKAMKKVLLAKFMKGHPYFKERLLATGDKKLIVEDKLKLWNVDLSKLLMSLRDALRKADGEPSKPAKIKSESSTKTKRPKKRETKSELSSKPEKKVKKKTSTKAKADPKPKKSKKGTGLNRRNVRPKRRGDK